MITYDCSIITIVEKYDGLDLKVGASKSPTLSIPKLFRNHLIFFDLMTSRNSEKCVFSVQTFFCCQQKSNRALDINSSLPAIVTPTQSFKWFSSVEIIPLFLSLSLFRIHNLTHTYTYSLSPHLTCNCQSVWKSCNMDWLHDSALSQIRNLSELSFR